MWRWIVLAVLLAGPALAQAPEDGQTLYETRCAMCHGMDAQGTGPMAEILAIAPPDLTRLAPEGAFPVMAVARQIDGRDPLLAHGGEMPIFGDTFDGEMVAIAAPSGQPILTSRPIAALIAYLESLQR